MGRFDDLRHRLSDRVASLANDDDDAEPDAKSTDKQTPRLTGSTGVSRHDPDDRKQEDYWALFEEVPLVREPIRAFATEVVAPGIEIEAGSEEAKNDLEEWLESSAIVNGEVDRDFGLMVKDLIIQREVRGTALVEKVGAKKASGGGGDGEDDDGALYGFKPISVSTVQQYTKPGQSILLAPDDTDVAEYTTDDGDAAAYVQFDNDLQRYQGQEPIAFSRDDIIKLTRDADVGEVFGTSRLAAVEPRVNSLQSKLDANDEAIQSKAWKFWLFKFGSDEDPWEPDDIEEFMSNHSSDEFAPGMKQGVQGDIDVQTIEGEVAEGLEEFLNFDVDWIISSMPLPKYALGGFEENVNQFVSRSQETRVNNQIHEARKELESEFNPVIKEKAEELGYEPEDIRLKIGPDEMPMPETDHTRPPASSEQSLPDDSVWAAEVDGVVDELADPRFISSERESSDLEDVAQQVFLRTRDRAVDRLRDEVPRMQSSAADPQTSVPTANLDRIVERELDMVLRQVNPENEAYDTFRDTVEKTLDRLESQPPHIEATFGHEDRKASRTFARDFKMAVEDAALDMVSTIRVQARTAVQNGEGAEEMAERVDTQFSESKLEDRAALIAHMELQNAIESIRLREYERVDSVRGVKPINHCSETTSPLCRNLAGCGDHEQAVAMFEDGDIGRQLQEQVPEDHLFVGFDPLPSSPPLHWGCSTELAPVLATEEEATDE